MKFNDIRVESNQDTRLIQPKETYLGDGLYASDDGYMVTLRAPRENGDHWVGLEPEVIEAFLRFLEKARGLKISVAPAKVDGQ